MSVAGGSIALAVSPALAPGKAAPYVIAAYIVFLAIVLIYVAIMARRLTRTEDEVAKLKRDVERSGRHDQGSIAGDERRREAEDLETVP